MGGSRGVDARARGGRSMSVSAVPRTPTDAPLLLRPADAARALAISPRTLWSLTHRGAIPCVRLGRAVRYDPRDLADFVDKKRRLDTISNS